MLEQDVSDRTCFTESASHRRKKRDMGEMSLTDTLPSRDFLPGCPHTSLTQSGVRPDTKPRETIEVRALVFTDE